MSRVSGQPPGATPTPIPVESIEDARVAVFRDLRDRDALGRHGVFIAEGDLVVRRLLAESPFTARSVFLSEARYAAMRGFLGEHAAHVPVYVAPQAVLDEVAGFHLHRGALAAGDRPDDTGVADLIRPLDPANRRATVVVLEDLANHDNVGGIFRSASAFGALGVILTRRCADPLYRKATRVSIGSTLTLPYARCDRATNAIAELHDAGFITLALTPDASATPITAWLSAHPSPGRLALLLGAEGAGLSRAALDAATARVRLGRMVGVDSLNVAVAAGVALHALAESG